MRVRSKLLRVVGLAGVLVSAQASHGRAAGAEQPDPPGPSETAPPGEPQPEQSPEAASPQDKDPAALGASRDALEPYGTWVDDARYGTVWVPDPAQVGADFVPYQSEGHWALDPNGQWLWVSDYAWGYIPFHYGRWAWIEGRGWAWVPGQTYAPAWVTWSVTPDYDYLGWAPMPPSFYWYDGSAVDFPFPLPIAAFQYVPRSAIFYPHVAGYVVHNPTQVHVIAGRAYPVGPVHPRYAPAGPSWRAMGISAEAARAVIAHPDARTLAYAHRSAPQRAAPASTYTPSPRPLAPYQSHPVEVEPPIAPSHVAPNSTLPAHVQGPEQPLRTPEGAHRMTVPRSNLPASPAVPHAPSVSHPHAVPHAAPSMPAMPHMPSVPSHAPSAPHGMHR